MKLNEQFAIVEIEGRQYKVSKGSRVRVDHRDEQAGTELCFENVLLFKRGAECLVGSPHIPGAKILAKVEEHTRSKKILVFKYLKKNKSKKMRGHRQDYTVLSITDILEQ